MAVQKKKQRDQPLSFSRDHRGSTAGNRGSLILPKLRPTKAKVTTMPIPSWKSDGMKYIINKAWRTLKGSASRCSRAHRLFSPRENRGSIPSLVTAQLDTKISHFVSSNEDYMNRQRPLSSRFPRHSTQMAPRHLTPSAPPFNRMLEREAKHHQHTILPQVLQDAMDVKFSSTMERLRLEREGLNLTNKQRRALPF
jgi:hypothetical protein